MKFDILWKRSGYW